MSFGNIQGLQWEHWSGLGTVSNISFKEENKCVTTEIDWKFPIKIHIKLLYLLLSMSHKNMFYDVVNLFVENGRLSFERAGSQTFKRACFSLHDLK